MLKHGQSAGAWCFVAFLLILPFRNTAQSISQDSLQIKGKHLAGEGRYQEAIQTLQTLLTIQLQQLPVDTLSITKTYTLLGNTSFLKQDFQKARDYFNQALKIQLQQYNQHSTHNTYLYINLANTHRRLQQPQKAIYYAKQALTSSSKGSYNLYSILGTSYYNTQQLDSALYHYQKALTFKSRPGVFMNIGDIHLKLGRPLIALKYYSQITNDPTLPFYTQVSLYYRKAKAWHAQALRSKLKNAERINIETKAWHLLQLADSLIKHRQYTLQNEKDKLVLGQWVQDITELGLTISHRLYQLATQLTQKQHWQTQVFYFGERQKASVLLDDLTKQKHLKVIQLPQIQQQLHAKDAVLHYSFGKDSLYAFAITKERIILKALPKDSVQKHWRPYNLYMHVPLLKECIRYMHQFYKWLVAPLYPYIGQKPRWLVIGGVLNVLPFDTFCAYQGANPSKVALIDIDFQQFPYLIRKHTIRYAPSAALAFMPQKPFSYQHQFLGVAPGTYQDTAHFPTLKYAPQEVVAIARMMPQKPLILLDKTANRPNVIKQGTQVRWLHLATHGVTHDQIDLNGVLLYEGKWLVKDFKDLKLQNDLVVLSSCSAIAGKFVPGEGRLAMPRSFLRAGVRNIVYTLWSVNDRLAARMMTSFYKYLVKGMDYAEALRQAKLEFLRDPKPVYGYPGLWAVFMLEGRY